MDRLSKITMSDIRQTLTETQTARDKLFIAKDIGVAIGFNKVFEKMVVGRDPFIVDEPRFILVTGGRLRITVNLMDYELHPGMAGYVGGGSIVQVHGDVNTETLNGIGIIFSDEALQVAMHGELPTSFKGQELHFFLEATDAEQTAIHKTIDAIWNIIHLLKAHKGITSSLLAAMVNLFDYIHSRNVNNTNGRKSRERSIFEGFIMLVNRHCADYHQLAFYADKLCISEKYHSAAVSHTSGTTAKEWIDRAIVTKAKVMLRHTDKQVMQIADELHFSNVSFFCKFFRRMAGMTPTQYRNQEPAL